MKAARLRVLMYHRVTEPSAAVGDSRSLISARPRDFERQMRHLAKYYRVVSAEQVLETLRRERALPDRAVLITFDDGYRDFGDVAWPVLRRHALPVTLFVPTAYPDHPERAFWWDRLAYAMSRTRRERLDGTPCGVLPLHTPEARDGSLRVLKRSLKKIPHADAMRLVEELCRELAGDVAALGKVLSWRELRELAADGVTVGAHTQTHPALTQLPIEEARAEVRGSWADLRRELGTVLPVFAYPFGDHNDAVAEIVRAEGFEMAVTCADGYSRIPSADPVRLRRTNITLRTTPLVFRVRLTRLGSYIDKWRHAAKGWRANGRTTPPRLAEA
jgi:peptidoglycan/xylan/chitin deacetylase (PgdA/CDA1 family)